MGIDIVADKYSTAIFELAQENDMLVQMEEDLAYVRDVFRQNPGLSHLLQNPALEDKSRLEIIQKIFGTGINKLGLQLLYVMVKHHRERYILPTMTAFITRSREARNILEAKVTVAKELTPDEEMKLHQKLQDLTGKEVIFDTMVDKSILGGFIVQIGDKRIDASVDRNLKEIGKNLLKTNSTRIEVTE